MSRITVIGGGYVGLITSASFARLGDEVTCLKTDPARLQSLREGRLPIRDLVGFFTLVYGAFSVVIGKNFVDVYWSNTDPLLQGLALGGLAALVGFQFNSLFHNFLDSTLTLWIIGGLSLVLLKIPPNVPSEPDDPGLPPRKTVLIRDVLGEWEGCAV